MKKFKFRLQRILDIKAALKEEKLRILNEKRRKVKELNDYLEKLEEAERQNGIPDGAILTASDLHLKGDFAFRLQEEIVGTRLAIVDADKAVEEALLEYTEASKEVKSLDALKEKRLEEYKEECLKDEERFLEELSVQRWKPFTRRRSEYEQE